MTKTVFEMTKNFQSGLIIFESTLKFQHRRLTNSKPNPLSIFKSYYEIELYAHHYQIEMDFVTPLITIIGSLIDTISVRIVDAADLDQNENLLRNTLEELTEARKDLESHVVQAESLGLRCKNIVKGWLQRVEKIEVEVSSILQDVDQQKQCLWCCRVNFPSRYKRSKKVLQKLGVVKDLIEKGKTLDINWDDRSIIVPVMEIPSGPVIGINVMLQKVYELLREEEVGVIGIYGMGGVGKTTLLKCINNEFLTRNHDFNVVIWATVSKDFVADKIQQAIGVRLGLSWDENEVQEQRAAKMYKVLKMKKFMLLLDDVWGGLDLEKIGIPLPNKGNKCKVIFTARSMDVCSDMDAHYKLKVEFLKEKDSWELFTEKVRRYEILNSPPIRSHAETIVKRCGGLPLALITIGKAMANKETEEEWIAAIEALNKSPSELRGMDHVFTLLKFSYEELGNDILKLLLLYCSLFPEDCSIEKELLIEYWAGEGFLNSSHEESVHYMGHALIGSLKVACFLETGDEGTQVKMHDVVRSFALWIASDCGEDEMKFLVRPSAELTEAPSTEKWEKAQRISLVDNEITELSKVPFCPHLLTLFLQWNISLSRISNGFFQFMPVLRVLDLSYTSLKEIPSSICNLVELRHLDMSGTKLSKLPKEMGGLAKLRYLDLKRTHYLRTIPHEALSQLSQLRVLNLYYSYGGWDVQDFEIETEIRFADLECLRHLTTLGITVTELTTLERLLDFSFLQKCIQFLYITSCECLFSLQLSPRDGKRLRRLSINDCCDLKYLAIDFEVEKNLLPSLEVLALHRLPSLVTVWRNPVNRGGLQNLRSVTIWYCNKLKNVSWIIKLPKLELIYLFYCKEIEEIIGEDDLVGEDAKAFQRLRTMSIRDLPQLTSISRWKMDFPSLQQLAVIDCPKLKKLPLQTPGVSKLPTFTVYGEKGWWNNLKWDDAATGLAFLPHFIATQAT